MKNRFTLSLGLAGVAALAVHISVRTMAYTGCAGDSTNSTVVAEYIFHEGAWNTAFNSGTGNGAGDATLTNGVSFNSDVPAPNNSCGWSINLPSTGSGSTTPAVESASSYDPLAGATNFMLMSWVKRQSAGSSSNTSARIVSDTSSTTLTSTTAGVELRFSGSTGTLALRVNGNEVSTSVSGIAPNEGNWHHVAVVYDGTRPATNTLSRNVHFYVDAIQRGDGNTLTNVIVAANSARLTVGNSAVSRGVGNLLVGKIDDVRMLRGFAPSAVGDGKTNATIQCYMNSNDDFEPPSITCPANTTVSTDAGLCSASGVALGAPTTADNCSVASVTNNAPASFTTGSHAVTWTVTDVRGNTNSCQQIVTIVDNEPPSVTCPANVTVTADAGVCTASNVNLGSPTRSDNCGVSIVSSNAPATYSLGATTVTWAVTDVNGNSASCQQQVTVVEEANGDCDHDGLTNYEEIHTYGTSPTNPDTDGDGMSDLFEVQYGLNPTSNADAGCKPTRW